MPEETEEDRRKRELDLELDEELKNTFPASDALTITRRGRPEKPLAHAPRSDQGHGEGRK